MKRVTLSLLVVLALVTVASAAEPIRWAQSLKDAVAQAKERGSMILICEVLSGEADNEAQIQAYSDPAFVKAAQNFVCLCVNPNPTPGTAKLEVDGRKEQTISGLPGVSMKHSMLAYNEVQASYAELNTGADGSTRFPFHFVIDANGKVLKEIANGTKDGGFGAVAAAQLTAGLMELTSQYGKGLAGEDYAELKDMVAKAAAARAKGDLGAALKLCEAVLKKNNKTSVADEAKKIRDEIYKSGEATIEAAEERAATDPAGAVIALEKLQEDFDGTDLEKKAKAKLAQLKRRPEVKAALDKISAMRAAEKSMKSAAAAEEKGDYAKALKIFDDVAGEFTGSEIGERAKAAADALRADEEKMATAHEQAAAKHCKGWLSMARSFAKNGMVDKAKAKYQEIIDKFPGTSFAEVAAEEMKNLP
jgi:tetratricopeptide repeat protein